MKKAGLTFILIFSALSAFAQSGVIKDITGTVELKPAGAGNYTPASAGALVMADTVISTGFKSAALVEVGSALIAVRPLTRLTLTEISVSSGMATINVNLQAGRVRVDVNPPAGARASVTVSSPVATASVRGTSFEFDTRNLRVNSGNVIFQGTRREGTLITAGFSSSTDQNGRAINPAGFGADAYRPQMPSGTQDNASPAAVTTGTSEGTPEPSGPSNPGGSGNPGRPGGSGPGNPTNPPSGDGDNTEINVNFN
jgi:hypothetical protein